MELQGANGKFIIENDLLIINRKGAGFLTVMNMGLQGDKAIPLGQITAVELMKPGFGRGYLRLSINGRDPVGGRMEAVRDENALLLDKKHYPDAEKMRDFLLDRISRGSSQTPAMSTADEIEKLASLKQRGFLTDEECTAKKRQLLGPLGSLSGT